MQTIPSLAVLAFLIPLFGIGKTPAIIALTAYGLLPILRNTYTVVHEVDPNLKEAATGMGMNSLKRLTLIELPLAMPVIMAGIRTSMVLIVGTTTIAALIGAGGLGEFIFLGLDRGGDVNLIILCVISAALLATILDSMLLIVGTTTIAALICAGGLGELILLGLDRGGDVNLILLGAIPAALLAIILDSILRGFEHLSKRAGFKSFIAMLIIAILVVASPLLFAKDKDADIVIGGKLGAEPAILINMYKYLIEDATDLKVDLKTGLGKTELVFSALEEGSIDLFPEFSGTAIVTHLGESAESNDSRDVYEQAKQGMKAVYQMEFLEPMTFNNTYTVATTKEFAEKYDLESIGDLEQVQDDVVAGFTLEFKDRYDGYVGMQEQYNLDIATVRSMEPGIRQTALAEGDVDIIDAYETDSYVVELDLQTLDDPKNLFPPYQGAPLMREETLEQYPELEEILNQLAGKVTNDEMREMNYQVDYEDASPAAVAKEYLIEQNLLQN